MLQVAVMGMGRRLLVQAVQEMFDLFETTAWAAGDVRMTRLVVVGRNLRAARLNEHFRDACC
jgi:G3E family GTPase